MLIAIKIGNSTINIAFFNNPYRKNFELFTFNTKDVESLQKKFEDLFSLGQTDCIISSVVPSATERLLNILQDKCRDPILITYKTFTGLTLKVKNPETFGSDRLCSAVAAYELYKKDVVIVDAGTATTITVVTKNAEIHGGAIIPGVNTMNEALSEKTAQLKRVNFNGKISALGTDTDSAIRSGIVLGSVFAIEGIIKSIQKEMGLKFLIILTGGYSQLLSKYMTMKHRLNKYLVIEGMRLIYLKNINKGGNHEN